MAVLMAASMFTFADIYAFAEDSVVVTYDEATTTCNVTGSGELKESLLSAYASTVTVINCGADITISGESVFDSCTVLEAVNIDSESEYYCSLDGVLFGKNNGQADELMLYPVAKSDISYTVPETVEEIRPYAFEKNAVLQEVTITSVKDIVSNVFLDCSALTTVNLTTYTTSISSNAFANCSSLSTINYNGTIEQWRSVSATGAFHSGISTICTDGTYEYGVNNSYDPVTYTLTISGNGAMDDYSSATDTNRPWVSYAQDIKNVVIEGDISSIGTYTFSGCTNLSSVTLPEHEISINDYAFESCSSLSSIVFPGITNIPAEHVFSGCYSLEHVTFKNETNGINSYLFCRTESLLTMTVPFTKKKFENSVFGSSYYASIFRVYFSDGTNMEYGTQYNFDESDSKQLNVDGYGYFNKAFFESLVKGGNTINTLKIGEYVTNLSESVFDASSDLEAIIIDGTESQYYSQDGVLFEKEDDNNVYKLVFYPNAKGDTSYTVPDGTYEIGSYSFESLKYLESVSIPDSVDQVSNYAFQKSSALKTVTLPNGITSMGTGLFAECTALSEVTIPSSVEVIGDNAFSNCSSLTTVNYNDTQENWNKISISETGNEALDTAAINYHNHTAGETVKENNIDPTCTAKGSYDNVVYCTVCNAEISRVTVTVDETGHSWDSGSITAEATCTQDGTRLYRCTVCGDTMEETIPAAGHTIVTDEAVEATCFETGLTEGSHCSVCGEIIVAQNIIDKIPHSFSKTVVSPTCTDKGYTEYNCSVCGYSYKEDYTDMLEHEYVYTSNGDETHTATCKNCTYQYKYSCSPYMETTTTEISLTAPGSTCRTCSKCGYTVTTVDEYVISGSINSDISYSLNHETHTLTISGEGAYNSTLFKNNQSVKNLVIGEGITSIGESAFQYCSNLESVTFPADSLVSIGKFAFSECGLKNLVIPDSVTDTGYLAFGSNLSLTYIKIGKKCKSVKEVFSNCSAVKEFAVDDENERFKAVDGNLYSKSGDIIYYYAFGKNEKSFTIPSGVVKIERGAFYVKEGFDVALSEIVIPDTVLTIGELAFSYTPIKSINIPDSVKTIGVFAFKGCENLTGIVIPDSVTALGTGAFEDCKSLSSAKLSDNMGVITEVLFHNCSSLGEIDIPDSVSLICSSSFVGTNIESIEIPYSVTEIRPNSFNSNTTVTVNNPSCSIGAPNNVFCFKSYNNCNGEKSTAQVFAESYGQDYESLGTADHTWDNGTVTAQATCTSKGTIIYTCTVCNETKTQETDIIAHSYNSGVISSATSKTYTKTFTCNDCGNKITRTYNKAANTLAAKGKTVKVKKNRKVTVKRKKAITIKNAVGKVTYSKVSVKKGKKSFKKKIAVNKKTGKITVKKGLKKGTYKVKIKVKAAGSNTYKAKTKTVTVKIIIK